MKAVYILALSALTLASCSAKQEPETRDWSSYTDIFPTQDESKADTYYKPAVGFCGDVMPYYDEKSGEYRVYYLQDFRPNPEGTYHPIWGVSTKDGASYTSMGEMIPCGNIVEQDAALGTGSVVFCEEDNLYYFFYTGHKHNPSFTDNTEAVQYATSSDGKKWTKCRSFVLRGDENGYSKVDFRDPEVIRLEDGYHMYISTRIGGKGVLAEYTSPDCRNWTHKGVFMTMMWDRFYECPNIFKMGNWWYLIYSDQTGFMRKVQYFKGTSLEDLAACTKDDAGRWPDDHEGFLDSRGFYAGKTASDGTNRYIWGWCPTRKGRDNTLTTVKDLDWAGNMVCHRLVQHEDGTLALCSVEAVAAKYTRSVPTEAQSLTLAGGEYKLMERLGYHNHLSMTVKAADKFAISLVRAEKGKTHYSLVFNPEDGGAKRKINFEQEGEEGCGFIPDIDGYMFPRPADDTYRIDIYTDNSVLVMYVNGNVCYTNRIYGMARNRWSINCYAGTLEATEIRHNEY